MVGCPKLIRGPYTESRGLALQPVSEKSQNRRLLKTSS